MPGRLGLNPGHRVAESRYNAVKALSDIGVDASGLEPKSVDSIDSSGFDSNNQHGLRCELPICQTEDWGLEDPVGEANRYTPRLGTRFWSACPISPRANRRLEKPFWLAMGARV